MYIALGGKNGGQMKVSAEDFEELSKHSWHRDDDGYIRGEVNGKNYLVHRYIMNASADSEVDHIDFDQTNNDRENLRIITTQQNGQNKAKHKNNSSSFYGVYYVKNSKKYKAFLKYNGKNIHIGMFENEIDAAKTFDLYLVKNKMDEFKKLNFPEDKEKYLKMKLPAKKENSSQFIGVRKLKNNKYHARVRVDNVPVFYITSKNEKKCARAYDKYIVENNIPNKKLNFPEEHPDYNPNSIIKTFCEEIDKNTVKLLISDNPNVCVKIDKEDYDRVKYYACCIENGYVKIYIDGKKRRIHRFLTKVTDPLIFVDHIDRDPMNNTKKNLRLSNSSKNGQNKSKKKNCTSDFYGVHLNNNDRWECTIRKNYTVILREYYKNEQDAARRRDIYILENLKDDCFPLNFRWNSHGEILMWKKMLEIAKKYSITTDQIFN